MPPLSLRYAVSGVVPTSRSQAAFMTAQSQGSGVGWVASFGPFGKEAPVAPERRVKGPQKRRYEPQPWLRLKPSWTWPPGSGVMFSEHPQLVLTGLLESVNLARGVDTVETTRRITSGACSPRGEAFLPMKASL